MRTLEFWIDHLHPDFLQPLMQPVMRKLMINLTSHLKPQPQPHSIGTTAGA